MRLTTLAVTGIMLWWGEGAKSHPDKRWKGARSYPIELTNSNPAIIKLFVDFLRIELLVPNDMLRIQVQMHEGENQAEVESFWSKITGVSRDNFHQTVIRPVGKKTSKSKGTCKVRLADKERYLELESLLWQVLLEIYEDPQAIIQTLPPYETVG